MSKNLSAKYYQKNKEKLQKEAFERYQSFCKKEKEKKATIWLWTLQKSLRRWKNKLVGYGKKYYREKTFYSNK